MSKALIAYNSRSGNTEKMAEYIAEGIRFSGNEAIMKKISEIKNAKDLAGFDGYVFGCPTYHRDMTGGMKSFLFIAEKANLLGKMGGAFGPYTHSGESAPMLFDTMNYVFKMDMVDMGALSLKDAVLGSDEPVRHDSLGTASGGSSEQGGARGSTLTISLPFGWFARGQHVLGLPGMGEEQLLREHRHPPILPLYRMDQCRRREHGGVPVQ